MPHFVGEAMSSSTAPASTQQSLAACLGMSVGQNLVKVEAPQVGEVVASVSTQSRTATKSAGAPKVVKPKVFPKVKAKAKAKHDALQPAMPAPLTEAASSAIVGPQAGSDVAAVGMVAATEGHAQQAQVVAANPSNGPKRSLMAEDKNEYNKFKYRLNKVPQEIKDYYSGLLDDKVKNTDEIQEVMDIVKLSHINGIPDDLVQRSRKIIDVSDSGVEGGWISWREALEFEDEDALLEMIAPGGSVLSRRSTKLPANTKIEWPRNLQVEYSRETFSKKQKTEDARSSNAKDENQGTFHNEFSQLQAAAPFANMATPGQPQAPAPAVPEAKAAPGLPERDKTTLLSLRKAHSQWDRSKRDYAALLVKSEAHPNTKGCKFATDLQNSIKTGDKFDSVLVATESHSLAGNIFTDSDIEKGVASTNQLVQLVKDSNQKTQALRTMLKVK